MRQKMQHILTGKNRDSFWKMRSVKNCRIKNRSRTFWPKNGQNLREESLNRNLLVLIKKIVYLTNIFQGRIEYELIYSLRGAKH